MTRTTSYYTWRRGEILDIPTARLAACLSSAVSFRARELSMQPIREWMAANPEEAIEFTQQELAESDHRFDDTEHRFRGLLA